MNGTERAALRAAAPARRGPTFHCRALLSTGHTAMLKKMSPPVPIPQSRHRSSVRERALVAHPGGDEFVAILEDIDGNDVVSEAHRIISAVGAEIELAGTRVRISCGMGIAIYPLHGRTIDSLFEAADAAMHMAKRNGKNCCHIEADEAPGLKAAQRTIRQSAARTSDSSPSHRL